MTRLEDIEHAIDLGVDAIGLIFYPHSLRCVSIEQAQKLTKNLPPFVELVAVLVNPDEKLVYSVLDALPIQLLQFHGDESAAFCEQFNTPFIKAIAPVNAECIRSQVKQFTNAAAVLFDTPSPTRGGTGLSFDWKMIPTDLAKPYVLAGGLNDLNIRDALKASNPYAVDVCSGIEVSPGIKDPIKMSRFIKTLWNIQ